MLILIPALALALPTSFAQDYEYDLRPPERDGWMHAGQSVAIQGDWAVVGGYMSSGTAESLRHLPALFRRDASGQNWDFVRRIERPDLALIGQYEDAVSIDGQHMLIVQGSDVMELRFDPVLDDWVDGPPFPPPPGPFDGARSVQVEGQRAIVIESPYSSPGNGRTIHTYEFDPVSGDWVWADALRASSGSFHFRARLFGDELITWVDHDDQIDTPTQIWVHSRTGTEWARTQVLDGAQLGSSNIYFGSPFDAEGDLLALSDGAELLIFERPDGTAPFALTDRLEGSFYWSLRLERGVVVGGGPITGFTDVWRRPSCMGGAWMRTHRLTTINKHAGAHPSSNHFGRAIDLDDGSLIVGAPELVLINGPFHGQRSGAASIFPVSTDLDENGVDDACQIQTLGDDVDLDGILDIAESPGSRYCSPNVPTSLGAPAMILLQGSERVVDNRLVVTMLGVPQGSYGLMIAGRQPGFYPAAGINDGNLCIAGGVARRLGRTHSYWFAGPDNVIHQEFDTSYSPWGTQFPLLPGETWFFQGWFRDGAASNMTDAMRIFFR